MSTFPCHHGVVATRMEGAGREGCWYSCIWKCAYLKELVDLRGQLGLGRVGSHALIRQRDAKAVGTDALKQSSEMYIR